MVHVSTFRLLATLAGLGLSACSAAVPSVPPPILLGRGASHPLSLIPSEPISLGSLPPGGKASGSLTLKNVSSVPIRVGRIETSCPCLAVSPWPIRIEAGSGHPLTIAFDPASEPEFRGRLGIELKGLDDTGKVLFEGRVDLEVLAGPARKPDPGVSP